jgi:hypothetical protein
MNEKKLDFELYNDKEITVVLQLKTGKILLCSENNLCLFDLDSKQKLTSIEIKTGIWAIRELSDGSVAIGQGNGDVSILEVVNNEIKIKFVLQGHKKAKEAGDSHEMKSTSSLETNMDLWNNQAGRQIGREIKAECKRLGLTPSISEKDRKFVYDMIAQKVVEAMKSGKLITNPNDSRKFIPRYRLEKDGTLTGLAANVTDDEKRDIVNKYKNSDSFSGMSDEEIWDRYVQFNEDKFFNPKNRVFYENEFNPALAPRGSNNDIGIQEMIKQYYENDYHLPQKEELDSRVRSGELVYVHDYTRADGTKVSGYYRAYPKEQG